MTYFLNDDALVCPRTEHSAGELIRLYEGGRLAGAALVAEKGEARWSRLDAMLSRLRKDAATHPTGGKPEPQSATNYSLAWEDMVWVLRIEGRNMRVQAFREKEQGIRYVEGQANLSSTDVKLTVKGLRNAEVLHFPVPPWAAGPHTIHG